MRKKFTLLFASLFLVLGSAWAQTAATYADGLYKIYWQADQRGYLTYHHADYPDRPQLAGVVNHNPNGHYQLKDEGVNLGWYLYTSQTSGKSYLFEATTGKFITIKPGETVGNGKACVLETEVSTESQLTLMAADGNLAGTGYLFRYVIGNTNYHFCSGCGANKGNNPVRFSSDGQGDGGNRFVFANAEGLTISDEIKNAAIAKIAKFEGFEIEDGTITNVLEPNKVYRVINKANAGKVVAENTADFKLHAPDRNDAEKSQLWYVEGDDIAGYTFRNLKSGDYMNFVDENYTHWGTTAAPIKFYLTKVEEANETTPDYYAIAFTTTTEKSDLAYAHYSNGNIVRWRAADKSDENYTSVNASLWQFEEVSIEALATLDASYTEWKNGITETIKDANDLMTTAGFSISPVALTTDNTTCPAAISDNSDGGGVPALLDDDNTTFMHTKYPQKGSYEEHHYIQVDLGENNSAKYITFSYRARHNNHNNNPEKMIIRGSVDGNSYTDIKTLTNLPDGNIEYTSDMIGNGTAYRYFRFVVTETTNNAKNGDYVFFALGKFRMNTVAVNDAYVSKTTVLGNMNEWINSHELAETRPEDWCLKTYSEWNTQVSDLIYGSTLREYPFTLTTDVNAPVCYQILSARANANNNTPFYFTLKPNDGGKVKLETSTKDNVYSYWFFMEEPATGMLIVVPFIDESNPLGYVTVSDGNSKLTNVHTTANFAGYYYELISYTGSNVGGFPYALKPYKANTNVSNHGGTTQFMGFYNGANDTGTAIKFEQVSPALEFRGLRDAIAAANALVPGDDRIGTGLNKYSRESVDACKAEINAAGQLYNVVSTSAEDLSEKITTLQNLYYNVLKLNQPEDGKFYRIRCTDGNRRLLSTTGEKSQGDTRLKLANTVNDESIFLYTDGALVSYQTALYINDRRYNDVGKKSTVTFSNAHNKVLGQYNIKVGDNHIYGAGDYLDSGSGTPDHRNGYNWWLEEDNITSLSVAVSAAGYATFIAPVALEIPEGVEAYTGVVTGNYLVLTPVTETIPANTGVVLKAAENTYNFKIVASTSASAIHSDLVGSTAAKDNEYKGEEDENTHIPYYTLQQELDENEQPTGNLLFMQYNGNVLAGSKAYLVLPEGQKSIGIRFEGTTDIEHSTLNPQPSTQIYDLLGRRVETITKGGIYIVNGKKVVVK